MQRKKNKAYRIVPVKEDDTLMSKSDLLAKIDQSLRQASEGQRHAMNKGESLDDFLNRVDADVQD